MDKDLALLNKVLDFAVNESVITDSEAEHLFGQFATHVNGDC